MKLGKHIRILPLIAALCLIGPALLTADVIVGTVNDWDPFPGAGAWSSEYGWTTVGTPASGGNPNGWLSVTFTNKSTCPYSSWIDILHTPASNLYAGTWSTNMWLAFDFWASNVIPNGLQVRWKSTTNSYIWGNVIDPPSDTNDWQTRRSASFTCASHVPARR